jgi:hypothetical protein
MVPLKIRRIKVLILKIKDVRTSDGIEYQLTSLYLTTLHLSWRDDTMKFLHRHFPIFANLVKSVYKVLLDMRVFSVYEIQEQENMSDSSYRHQI